MQLTDVGVIATIVVATVGGLWGLFKHIKSRFFETRLTLGVSARSVHSDSGNNVVCTLKVTNIGLSKVDIDKAHVRLSLFKSSGQLTPIINKRILLAQGWIEPGSTLNEEDLIPCAVRHGIVKIEFRLVSAGSAFKTTSVLELSKLGSQMERSEATSPT